MRFKLLYSIINIQTLNYVAYDMFLKANSHLINRSFIMNSPEMISSAQVAFSPTFVLISSSWSQIDRNICWSWTIVWYHSEELCLTNQWSIRRECGPIPYWPPFVSQGLLWLLLKLVYVQATASNMMPFLIRRWDFDAPSLNNLAFDLDLKGFLVDP